MRALMEGRMGDAWRWLDETERAGARAPGQNSWLLTSTLRCFWLVESGDAGQAVIMIEQLREGFLALGSWARVTWAFTMAHARRPDEARRVLDTLGVATLEAIPSTRSGSRRWLSWLRRSRRRAPSLGGVGLPFTVGLPAPLRRGGYRRLLRWLD